MNAQTVPDDRGSSPAMTRQKQPIPWNPDKKAGRGWHHHSRAPRHRSMGQGGRPAAGMTPKPPGWFLPSKNFFHTVK
jgi:hypothetical protein